MKPVSWLEFRQKAARNPQRILLAEGEDLRVIQAAHSLNAQKITIPVLVGSRKIVESLWKKSTGKPLDVECIDPKELSAADKQAFVSDWLALARNKNQTPEEALAHVQDPLVLGSLYLKKNKVDGFVGGASRTTADTLRAVFNVIGLGHRVSTLFGFFFLEKRVLSGPSDIVLLADCAVIPDPSAKQLAHIAIGAAAAWQFFIGEPARIAFLSFSTLGSASHPMVDKIKEALRMAREKAPELQFEGEWQADAALDVFTAGVKGAGSSAMAGQANILIVPDLNCGNIAYKLAQRLGQIRAVGPVLWGMAQPANDLSRGCTSEDIVDMAALTAIQAQARAAQSVLHSKEMTA